METHVCSPARAEPLQLQKYLDTDLSPPHFFTVFCDASVHVLRGLTGSTADVPHSPVSLPTIVFAPGFHERWISRSGGQNLVNCSVCAEIYSVLEVPESLRATMTLRRGAQLLLLKVRFG